MDIATVVSILKSRQDLTIDIYRESYSLLESQENMSVAGWRELYLNAASL
jgi:hypothetical protein